MTDNKKVLKIAAYWEDCPKEWQGFIDFIFKKYNICYDDDVLIQKELEKFNCKIVHDHLGYIDRIVFQDEDSHMLFKLVYG